MSILKRIYRFIPSDIIFVVAKAIRFFGQPPIWLKQKLIFSNIFSVVIRKGLSFKMRATGKWIENDLFWMGISGYEKASIDIWMKAAEKSNVIIDVGANTGVFSLIAKAIQPQSEVIAFEPLPWALDLLKENTQINNFEIEIVSKAVSNKSGVADFYFPEENQGNIYSSTLSKDHYSGHNDTESKSIKVSLISLDEYCASSLSGRVDLIKIDAEGNDHYVIFGMKDLLKSSRPAILMEVQNDIIAQSIQSCLPPSYLFYSIDETQGLLQQDSIKSGLSLNYFLCPAEKEYLLQ